MDNEKNGNSTGQKPVAMRKLTPEELNEELKKGLKSVDEGRTYSQEEFDAMLAEDLGI
ncbi:MAG: hypothetical protein LUD50_03535 [Clostridia bacterium]|nr:hypothetical protein [Clostridia bacterium]